MRMMGGLVVPPYDPGIEVCGYCGKTLVWGTRHEGGTEASWEREQAAMARGEALFLAWGPPRDTLTYGCPDYGKKQSRDGGCQMRELALASGTPWEFGGPELGWHYFWWDETTLEAVS